MFKCGALLLSGAPTRLVANVRRGPLLLDRHDSAELPINDDVINRPGGVTHDESSVNGMRRSNSVGGMLSSWTTQALLLPSTAVSFLLFFFCVCLCVCM